MQVILEATAGPITGRRIEVPAGTILRIGRTAKSDYAIGEDSYLSGQHFAVECDGIECRIRDLGSSNGTFLNGNRVTETVAAEGDSVVAGGSTFSIHMEAREAEAPAAAAAPAGGQPTANYPGTKMQMEGTFTLPTAAFPVEWPSFTRPQSTLLSALYHPGENVYAVVDASRDSRIPAFLDASGEPHAALDPFAQVPAYVVSLSRQSRLLDVLVKDGWGRGWGFYCTTPVSMEEVCAHWRHYAFLRTEDGRKLTFRFWDARVLRALVPLMPASEAAEFFGPLSRLIVEGEKADIALELSLGPRGPRQQTLVLL